MNRLPFPTIGLFLLGCYSGMTLIRLIENPENFRGIKSLLGFKTEEEEAEELFKKRQMGTALGDLPDPPREIGTPLTELPPGTIMTSSTDLTDIIIGDPDPVDNEEVWSENEQGTQTGQDRESQNLLNLLYTIAEDQARKEGYAHRGITCNFCGQSPIRGVRYKCTNCYDFDLCESCESKCKHERTHVFLKLRIPIPPLANPRSVLLPVFYPGKGNTSELLSKTILTNLQKDTHFDKVELEALFEQFKSLACDQNNDDRGINKETFERCLGPLGVGKNLVTERIYSFFDRNGDGYIDFQELACGLSIICKGSQEEKIEYAFKGYDLDDSGFISRDELRKMFKAYFYLSMELVRDVVKALEEEMMANFDDEGDKPVSAWFNAPIPRDASEEIQANEKNNSDGLSPFPNSLYDDEHEDQNSLNEHEGDGVTSPTPLHDPAMVTSSSALNFVGRDDAESFNQNINSVQNLSQNFSRKKSMISRQDKETWPLMEAMSKDAIDEMVDNALTSADVNQDGQISFEEFKEWASTDTTMIAWFEALGSVF